MSRRPGTTENPVFLPDGSDPCPYGRYRELRESGRVHVVEEPTGLQRWTLVRYAESRKALADERLSKDPRNAREELLRTGYLTGDRETDEYMFHILNSDPPDHTRLRRIVLQVLTASRIHGLLPRVQAIAEELALTLAGDRSADLIGRFALPFAVRVMGELLGVATGDFDEYHECATAALMPPGSPSAPMTRAEAYRRMKQFIGNLVATRREEMERAGPDAPRSDVVGALLAAHDEGTRLSDRELVSLVMFLLNTGQEPTVNMIGNGMLALLQHPEQLGMLRRDPRLLAQAIEEMLRFEGPLALSTFRVARQDLEMEGVVIPAGAIVSILLGSANRDEWEFAAADRFDITRAENAHLAFGHGAHSCPGTALARMMGRVAFSVLLASFPDLALARPAESLRWRSTRVMRGLVELPVALGRARGGELRQLGNE